MEELTPGDSHIFPAYILPALQQFSLKETEESVRQSYAECLASLAETSKKFLEISQKFKKSHSEVNKERAIPVKMIIKKKI